MYDFISAIFGVRGTRLFFGRRGMRDTGPGTLDLHDLRSETAERRIFRRSANPPRKLGEIRDSFTIIGAVNFTMRAGPPGEVVAKLQELAREHGADVITLDSGADYQQQVGIYIPPTTTYLPTPVYNSGNVTVTNPYGAPVAYGKYTNTQTQYVPHTNPGVDTRRVINVGTFVARFYGLNAKGRAILRSSRAER